MGENMIGIVIWLVCVWGCAMVFTGIGIYAGKSDKPMHFWSGTTVNPEAVKDIHGYNGAMKKLWFSYSVPFYISGLLYIFHSMSAVILLLVASTIGITGLIWGYLKIEKKYVNKNLNCLGQNEEQRIKNSKAVKFSIFFAVVIFLACGILMFTGDVKTKVTDDGIQMKATYWGTKNILWKDITEVKLEDSFSSGSKTGGFNSAKLELGNYTNEKCGHYLIYRYTKCKSCILLTTNQGYVAVNQKTEQETETLYNEIQQKLNK